MRYLLRAIAHLCVLATLPAAAASAQAEGTWLTPRCLIRDEFGSGCRLYHVPLGTLLEYGDLFDDRRVQTIGYVHFEFEGNGLYLQADDALHYRHANGVWVDPAAYFEPPASCQDAKVRVEGTFHAGSGGHGGLWPGALTDLTSCELEP